MVQSKNKMFAKRILSDIEKGIINSQRDLSKRRFYWSKELKLSHMPSNPFVLAQKKKHSKKALSLLAIKPTRSLSGVQVIAVMLPPFKCPGECIYCPSPMKGKKAPQSYTGFEPSTMRAQRYNYDSYKIVEGRVKQLDATGNFAEKIELIFQGSSFTALDKRKQISVVKKSLDAISGKKTRNFEESKLNAEKAK